ncbi:MAG: capsular polysaccharide biosynthesis protein [Oscillospiraceae bacterium]|nr:capsular polysaccharide biosynthesis protein [Oscillospiraceae bacterium]
MIDIHSHILPGIDDGSKSVEMSVAMLRMAARQGVRVMAATPHFYAWENTPERFLRHRKRAWEALQPHLEEGFPELVLGAEVQYFEGITLMEELEELQLEGRRLLLLEMPFSQRWSSRMISDVVELNGRRNTTVLLAHIERYMDYQKKDTWKALREQGVLMQCNASFFLERKTRRKALKMLKDGEIHMLGSDCHNTDSRAPDYGAAAEAIRAALGNMPLTHMERSGQRLLEDWISPR